MNNPVNPQVVEKNSVVSLQYTLTVDGKVVDSADQADPLQFIQGTGHIIPGLERELYGMATGDSKTVSVSPQDGYGEIDPDAKVEIPRNQFPPQIPVKKGVELQVQNNDGEIMNAFIDSFTKDSIRLDFNHPLAGKTLVFDVTVVNLREATAEELDHGHVHGGDHEEEGTEDEAENEEEYDDEEDGDD